MQRFGLELTLAYFEMFGTGILGGMLCYPVATGYGKEAAICLCNPIPYEHHVRHGRYRVPD